MIGTEGQGWISNPLLTSATHFSFRQRASHEQYSLLYWFKFSSAGYFARATGSNNQSHTLIIWILQGFKWMIGMLVYYIFVVELFASICLNFWWVPYWIVTSRNNNNTEMISHAVNINRIISQTHRCSSLSKPKQ